MKDNKHHIPNKVDLLKRMKGCHIFSKFDLKSRFWQVAVKDADKFKTTFSVAPGHYEWNVMLFGLKNAPSKFQRVMDNSFKP